MLNKTLFLFCRFIWWATPLWLSDLIYKKTGYLMGKRFTLEGKPVAFYVTKFAPFVNSGSSFIVKKITLN